LAFEPAGFSVKLGLKDVGLMLDAAARVELPLPLASVLRDRFLGAEMKGQHDLDWSAIGAPLQR
jgi:3-hydroxyisobutyrate dehydrogenase-like beta-hydroxyacid dehydrogenase